MTRPSPSDLAVQLRQTAAEMASKNIIVAEAARGRAPGLLAGAADELERVRAAIDRHVASKVHMNVGNRYWHDAPGCQLDRFDTRAEAEAAYRKAAFPGMPLAPAAGGEALGGERAGEREGGDS